MLTIIKFYVINISLHGCFELYTMHLVLLICEFVIIETFVKFYFQKFRFHHQSIFVEAY